MAQHRKRAPLRLAEYLGENTEEGAAVSAQAVPPRMPYRGMPRHNRRSTPRQDQRTLLPAH